MSPGAQSLKKKILNLLWSSSSSTVRALDPMSWSEFQRGFIWWQEIVGGHQSHNVRNLFCKTSHNTIVNRPQLHAGWNWWDKYADKTAPLGRDKTEPIWGKSKSDEWIFATQQQRWSGSTGKKRARKTARSFQCGKKWLGKTVESLLTSQRGCVQSKRRQECSFLSGQLGQHLVLLKL